jgi:hypothetical protein
VGKIQKFERKGGSLKPLQTVLIVCEDKKSSKTYLEDAARHFRANVKVVHCDHTDPLGIVMHAISQKHQFDSVFCAIDRDRHENFDNAEQAAKQHATKLTIIASYPCYEFWLLLHFNETTKPYAPQGNRSPGDCVVHDLRAQPGMENYGKDMLNVFEQLRPQLTDARLRSKRVLEAAKSVNELNPSTRLHELIDFLETLGGPLRPAK